MGGVTFKTVTFTSLLKNGKFALYYIYKKIIIMESIIGIRTAYVGILSIGFIKGVGVFVGQLELDS